MIQSVKELHIYIDSRVALQNSNRQLALSTQQKDMYANAAVLQFIESRSSDKLNIKREGFEDTQKRYDDLRLLKRKYDASSVYEDSTWGIPVTFAILPKDYLKLIPSGRSYVQYNCNGISPTTTTTTETYIKLPFPNDITAGTSFYAGFALTLNATPVTLTAFPNVIHSAIGKFMIQQYILSLLLNAGYNVYWEHYDSIYERDCFIIVGSYTSGSIAYTKAVGGTLTTAGTIVTRTLSHVDNTTSTSTIKENELVSSGMTIDSINNYYMQKNRHLKPMAFLENNRYYTIHNNNFIVTGISFEYIKKPLLISTELNQLCELDKLEEIGDIAVQLILADSGSPQYSVTKDSNIKSE